jgi:fermentation-respiration switch protein FrsA (DUF1100 family)
MSMLLKLRLGYTPVVGFDTLPALLATAEQEHAAIVVGAPNGAVKEQGPGIYAQNMALRGFVALTFDPSFNGFSGEEPRHVSSPDIFVEDFSAAVDYLGTRPFVSRERIGVIGMCGSGALSLRTPTPSPVSSASSTPRRAATTRTRSRSSRRRAACRS